MSSRTASLASRSVLPPVSHPPALRLVGLVLAAIIVICFVGVFPAKAAPAKTASPGPLLGVVTPPPPRMSDLDQFEAAAGAKADIYTYYALWAYNSFDRNLADAVVARGMTPEITWEPWDWLGGVDQPNYSLASIANGSHDEYVRSWARDIRRWKKPIRIRFAHEMNSPHYPWGVTVNGNKASDYVAAWRHVVSIFRSHRATNVSWVWSPSPSQDGTVPISQVYPGDEYVDWLGVDGYNWGNTQPWASWSSFDTIFGQTLAEFKTMTTKPVAISETASTEFGGDKAAWISDFFYQLKQHPEIRAFTWFNYEKETNWPITSSEAARRAFAAGVAAR